METPLPCTVKSGRYASYWNAFLFIEFFPHHKSTTLGGEDDQDQPLSSIERFDMRSFKWETLPPMEDALTDPPAAAHGQYIYVMGGLLGMLR